MGDRAVVGGRFRLVRELGSGGMGTVHEAEDLERGGRVALKILRRLDGESLLRFKQEFRSLEGLHHPNLVALGELGEDQGRWFFTMELVRGVDFLAWVRGAARSEEPGAWHEGRLRAALAQLARGLAALHRADRVHRDVKTSNVLVVSEGADAGRVVLCDFGLVADPEHDLSHLERERVVGTIAFMAPEQAAGKPVGPAADWYGMGALLFLTLTGRLPHVGGPEQVLERKQRDDAPHPAILVPGIPRDLDQLCVDLLARDPAQRPDDAEVLRRLRVDDEAAGRPGVAPFVGRAAELAELEAALARVGAGAPVTVLVHGEAGVGKSALVRELIARVPATPRPLILRGRCYQRDALPFKAIDPLFDALTEALAATPERVVAPLAPEGTALLLRAFPALRRIRGLAGAATPPPELDAHDQRRLLFRAVRQLAGRLPADRRLIVVIDDLQWADADSLALLRALLEPPDAPPLLLLATVRTDSAGATPWSLDELVAELPGDLVPLALGPLPDRDARVLARHLVDGGDPEALLREARGLPLYLETLARHRASATRLDDALWAAVERAGRRARRVVELLAVAGRPLQLALTERAAGLAGDDLPAVRQALGAAHLTRASGVRAHDRIELDHERLREAVLAHLDRDEVRARHRALAAAHEEAGDDPRAAALSWSAAGEPERAAPHAARAADEAVRAFAFDSAAELYKMALAGLAGDELARGRIRLGDALACAGRGAEAAEAYLAAALASDPATGRELRRRAAETLLKSGHIDRGHELLRQVTADLGIGLARSPRMALVQYLGWRAALRVRGLDAEVRDPAQIPAAELAEVDAHSAAAACFNMTDNIVGRALGARALWLALRCGEPARLAIALAVDATGVASAGAPSEARAGRMYDRAAALARQTGDPFAEAYSQGVRGFHDYFNARWRKARDRALLGERLFRETGRPATYEVATLGFIALNAMAYLGELRTLAREVPARLAEQRGRDNLYAASGVRTGHAALLWLARDDPDGMVADVDAAMREWSARGFHVQHYMELNARVSADLYRGAADTAARRLEASREPLRRSLLLHVQVIRIQVRWLRARVALARALRSGRRDDVRAAHAGAQALDGERVAWAQALAAGVRAGLAMAQGEHADAERQAALAEAGFAAADMALCRAVWQERLGTLLGERGENMRSASAAWFRKEGVRAPDRMCALFAPWPA